MYTYSCMYIHMKLRANDPARVLDVIQPRVALRFELPHTLNPQPYTVHHKRTQPLSLASH